MAAAPKPPFSTAPPCCRPLCRASVTDLCCGPVSRVLQSSHTSVTRGGSRRTPPAHVTNPPVVGPEPHGFLELLKKFGFGCTGSCQLYTLLHEIGCEGLHPDIESLVTLAEQEPFKKRRQRMPTVASIYTAKTQYGILFGMQTVDSAF